MGTVQSFCHLRILKDFILHFFEDGIIIITKVFYIKFSSIILAEVCINFVGIGKLSTTDGKAFADPEVLRRLSSSVSCALDEAAAALSKMKTETENSNENSQERYCCFPNCF